MYSVRTLLQTEEDMKAAFAQLKAMGYNEVQMSGYNFQIPPERIAALLEKQVQSGVRWEVTVRRLAELGVDTAIEIGPGRALTGFVKKTVGSAISCYPVETAAQLQQLLRTMKGA